MEFNSLSIVYQKPSERVLKESELYSEIKKPVTIVEK